MLKLVRFLKEYKTECIIGPLFKFLEACFELAVPLVMAAIIDTGIKNNDTVFIYKMGGFMVFLGLLGLVCSLSAQYFAAKAALGFGTALRNCLFAHIEQFSYAEIDKFGTPSLITRLTSDINQAQSGVNLVLRLFLRSPFIVVGALTMAFWVNTGLTLIFLIVTPLIGGVIYWVMSRSLPYYKKIQGQLDKISLIVRENLSGVRVIRSFARQKEEQHSFDTVSREYTAEQITAGKIAALLNPGTYLITNMGIIALLWFGSKTVFNGEILQGEIIALVNYMSQILLALVAVANLIVSFTKASACAARINEVFEQLPVLSDKGNIFQTGKTDFPKIVFDKVCFAYQNSETDAISDISFQVNSGEMFGIIGGTGSGKSTVVNLLCRFYDARKGQIIIDGIDVKEYPFTQLRRKIGIVPQNAVLFNGTVRDNIRWGKQDATDEEIWDALEKAQAKEFVTLNPLKLEMKVLQGGKNLSGGQKQRITIARALVGKPEILVLDDSASALDYATDAKLLKTLRDRAKETTVVIVSQRASAIKEAEQILVLDDGKAAGLGKHADLFENCPVYREICLSQLSAAEVPA